MRLPNLLSALLAVCAVAFPAVTRAAGPPVDVAAFARNDTFRDLKISPDGKYYAATIPMDDRTVLVILDRDGKTVTGSLNLGKYTEVAAFEWVNNERVLVSSAQKFGSLDAPQADGNLYGVNFDGSKIEALVGQAVQGAGAGTKIQPKKVEVIAAFLIDGLPADDRKVLISARPFAADSYGRAEELDVYTGRRVPVARAPIRNATFFADNAGVIRFVEGSDTDNINKLQYRADNDAPWTLVNDEGVSGVAEMPIGFSADNAIAYLQVERKQGPDAIVAFDIASKTRKDVLVDATSDPAAIIYAAGSSVPIGVRYADGLPRTAFFDPASPRARLQRSLESAFRGQVPVITSTTTDGKLALVQVFSDRNPGDFYVFDTVAKKAQHLASRGAWIDPETMGSTRPVTLAARDGLALHGLLTVPKGSDGRKLPMVVLPHGGPFGIQDYWGFDSEVQMLAAAGYGVLQVNFRGSAGFGRAFTQAGAREWGKAMQDDLTDATKWAIAQGHADSSRICIFGASYGAYAALMGVAKEPALYRCAAGYVGVYDLPGLSSSGQSGSRKTFGREWIGDPATLGPTSPNRIAKQIKAPVFLAAGGEDETAPIKQTKMMEQALGAAGVPVETLYYPNEGHGFYKVEHREAFYTQLLAFLSRNIGGATAAPAKPVSPAAAGR